MTCNGSLSVSNIVVEDKRISRASKVGLGSPSTMCSWAAWYHLVRRCPTTAARGNNSSFRLLTKSASTSPFLQIRRKLGGRDGWKLMVAVRGASGLLKMKCKFQVGGDTLPQV